MIEIIRYIIVLITAIQSFLSTAVPAIQSTQNNNIQNSIQIEQQTQSDSIESSENNNENTVELYFPTNTIVLETHIFDQLKGEYCSYVGCGPTSAAMLLSSETDTYVSKDEAVKTAYNEGFYYLATENFISGKGVILDDIQKLLNYYGYESEIDHLWNDPDYVIIEKINTHLDDGHRMIIGHCTNGGSLHYAVIYGKYFSNNSCYYNIVDPWGGNVYVWSQNELINHLKWVNGYDDTTFNGLVKGILYLK